MPMRYIEDNTIEKAYRLLCDTENRESVDQGYYALKELADNGNMEAAAYFGFASQLEYIGHYDLDTSKEYLEKACNAGNPLAQYYVGSMMLNGEKPFAQDTVYGKWLLEQSAASGNEDAKMLLKHRYSTLSPQEVRSMFIKSSIKLFFLDIWVGFINLFRKGLRE